MIKGKRHDDIKIVLCTTFREFFGGKNDKIQQLFLKSIKRQTYDNYQVVVTTFGEKNVCSQVKKVLGEKATVIEKKVIGCKFSLSDVFLNGVDIALKYEKAVVIWCCCDLLFSSDLFEKIAGIYQNHICGTYHPNIIVKDINKMSRFQGEQRSIDSGMDLFFFDAQLFKNRKNYELLELYRFKNWGFFEYFLAGMSLKISTKRYNIFPLTRVYKVLNDREEVGETSEYFKTCVNRNLPVAVKFANEQLGERKYAWFNICYGFHSHMVFRLIKWDKKIIAERLKYILKREKPKKSLTNKDTAMMYLYNQWLLTRQQGKSIVDYLEKNRYKEIAIYGMSYVGERLLDELKGSKIQVKYAIDRNANNIHSGIKIITPEDTFEQVDAIVVTSNYYFDEIKKKIAEKSNCTVINIEDILYEL